MASLTKPRWTKSEINWLLKNYAIQGPKLCSIYLNRSYASVQGKGANLGLKADTEQFSIRKSRALKGKPRPYISGVDIKQFYIDFNPYSVYYLGFLWADGYLYKNTFFIENTKKDLDNLSYIFNALGEFVITERTRKDRQPQKRIQFGSQTLFKILQDCDYTVKSSASAAKVLNKIPIKLRKYWFMGLIDGDGCFYFNPKNNCRQFTISSNYEQDWSYFESLCQSLEIKYSIQRVERDNGNRYSILRICNKEGIKKLGGYLYNDSLFTGLPRKHQKYLDIIS